MQRNPFQMGFDFTTEDSIYKDNHALSETQSEHRFLRETQERYQIRSPADAALYCRTHIFHPFETFIQEEMWLLLLNTKMMVTHDAMIYRGTLNSIPLTRLGEVFRPAVLCASYSVLLTHCHPSGDPTPSPEDVTCTEAIVAAGNLLNITVADHLIIGSEGWISLKEKGLGFK